MTQTTKQNKTISKNKVKRKKTNKNWTSIACFVHLKYINTNNTNSVCFAAKTKWSQNNLPNHWHSAKFKQNKSNAISPKQKQRKTKTKPLYPQIIVTISQCFSFSGFIFHFSFSFFHSFFPFSVPACYIRNQIALNRSNYKQSKRNVMQKYIRISLHQNTMK